MEKSVFYLEGLLYVKFFNWEGIGDYFREVVYYVEIMSLGLERIIGVKW